MKINDRLIRKAFAKAEQHLEFCWQVLTDIKSSYLFSEDFTIRFLQFQDKLATTIFELQTIRDQIILEEKTRVRAKSRYNQDWFLKRMRNLNIYKTGIDKVVATAKDFGDAYAHFFYQQDLEMLQEHLRHQKVINHTAGFGERGELEFVKRVKHIEGDFVLFHGITNTLRYGDFSFIDLKTMRINSIGELKTSQTGKQKMDLNLKIFTRKKMPAAQVSWPDPDLQKTRRGRQELGIVDFLLQKKEENAFNKDIVNESYASQINKLVSDARIGVANVIRPSAGLVFSCIKFKKASLYHRHFLRESKQSLQGSQEQIQKEVMAIIKKDSTENSLVMSQLLDRRDHIDPVTPGTLPIFWQEIPLNILKQLYFGDSFVVSIFNPLYLIEQVKAIGFEVESKHTQKPIIIPGKPIRIIQQFDRFLPYILNHLSTEEMVLDSIRSIIDNPLYGTNSQIKIKLQQHMPATQPIKHTRKS